MLALQILLLIVGMLLLVKGADWFVDGSAGVARKCKISTLVIGLTVVAFGTSAPELAVSVTSAIQKSTEIAIGNVVGSNIVNILLILGVSALIRPLPVQKSSLKLDFPAMLLATALLIVLGLWQYTLQWWDGLILLAVFSAYMAVLLTQAKKEQKKLQACEAAKPQAAEEEVLVPKGRFSAWLFRMKKYVWLLILLVVVGLGMVVGGSLLFVDAAKYIASYAGVPERVIGLTVVAIGTSLPELVTSVVAAIKNESDIAVGNVIGSNIFNIFVVAGASSLFYPLTFTHLNLIDALVAFGAAALLYFFSLMKGDKIRRYAGAIMLLCCVGYYVYLFMI